MNSGHGSKKSKSTHGHDFAHVLGDLKSSGLKLTEARKAILKALTDHHGPFTVEEIHKLISKKICDQATVYRNLSSLADAGLIRRCEFGDGSARFELAEVGEHHHHIICNKCKRVEIIDDPEIEEIDRFARKRGFADVSHILEFFGTCPQCK